MTQEEKSLLLKDLCGRLPYGVKCKIDKFETIFDLRGFDNDDSAELRQRVIVWKKHYPSSVVSYPLIDCKPYLRPMSSMCEEEKKIQKDYIYHFSENNLPNYEGNFIFEDEVHEYIDWLNAHHFDYRGLIEKGLAIEVTEENNQYEEINL